MIIYYLALTLTLLICIIFKNKKRYFNISVYNFKLNKTSYFDVVLITLPLILVMVFRWDIGVDVHSGTGYYYVAYNYARLYNANLYNYENGFYYLLQFFANSGLFIYWFYVCVSLIFMGCICKYISKMSVDFYISFLVFFFSDLYLFAFSTLRQALAIGFMSIVLCYLTEILPFKLLDKKNWKILFFTLIALSFHLSTIYIAIVYLTSKIKIKKQTLLKMTCIGILGCPIITYIVKIIMSHTIYGIKYTGTNEYATEFTASYALVSLMIFLIAYWRYDKLVTKFVYAKLFINCSAFITIIMFNSSALIMAYRVFPSFVPIYMILCAYIVQTFNNKLNKLIVRLACLIPFLMIFINQYYIGKANTLFQYYNIFSYYF